MFQLTYRWKKDFMGPEESMQIQSNLASTIAMALMSVRQALQTENMCRIRWTVPFAG